MVVALGNSFLLGGAGAVGGRSSEVALLSNNRLATVWVNHASSQDPIPQVGDRDTTVVLLRLSDANGNNPGRAIQVNTSTSGMQGDPQILALSGGRFVVAWTDGPTATGQVEARAQIFSASGARIGGEIQLATLTAGDQEIPRLVATNGGEDFYASWTDARSGLGDGLVTQHFDGLTGARIGGELIAASYGISRAEFVQMTDGSYRYVSDWVHSTDLLPRSDYASILDLQGTVVSNDFAANGLNWDAEAIAGNLLVIAGQRGGLYGVPRQVGVTLLAADGQPLEDSFGRVIRMDQAVNQTAFGFAGDSDVQVHALANGGFLVVWVQPNGTAGAPDFDIYAQQFDREFYAIGPNVLVHQGTGGQQYAPSITDAPNGRVLISWTSDAPVDGGNPSDVYGRLFRIGTIADHAFLATTMNDRGLGTAAANTVDLLEGADWYNALGGNDTVTGGNGHDFLIGGAGDDSLLGGFGFDVLQGSAGNDVLDGGYDFSDWVLFEGNRRVTVNLTLTTAQNTGQGMDTILSVENIRSGGGNDRLTGNALDNRLESGAGNDMLLAGDGTDVLLGGAGDDSCYGGAGYDYLHVDAGNDLLDGGADSASLVYDGSANGVVNLQTGRATFVGLGTDTLRNIHVVQSGSGHDRLTGNAGFNNLYGRGGRDTITGGGGDDNILLDEGAGTVEAWRFADVMIFRSGDDNDQVLHFDNDLDELRLDITGITTAAQALALASDYYGSVRFEFGNGDTLRVGGITMADLADDIVIL